MARRPKPSIPAKRGLPRSGASPCTDEAAALQPVPWENLKKHEMVILRNLTGRFARLNQEQAIITGIAAGGIICVSHGDSARTLRVSPHYYRLARTWRHSERQRARLQLGMPVRCPAGIGVVARIGGSQKIAVQLDASSSWEEHDLDHIMHCDQAGARMPLLKSLLMKHQDEAAKLAAEKPSLLAILPAGSGKTLLGCALIARSLQGLQEPSHVRYLQLAVIICPAALVTDVWMKAFVEHTNFQHRCWSYRSRRSLPPHAMVLVISYASQMTEATFAALVQGREIVVVIADEIAEVRNGHEHWETANVIMKQHSARRLGMAAIPISTNLMQLVRQCELLQYDSRYCQLEFYRDQDPLQCMQDQGVLYWLKEEDMVANIKAHPVLGKLSPDHHPHAKVPYEPGFDHSAATLSFGDIALGCAKETFEANNAAAWEYSRRSNPEAGHKRILEVCNMQKSKLSVTLDVLTKMFCGVAVAGCETQVQRHWKIVVVAVFLSSLDALQAALGQHLSEFKQYRYDGTMTLPDRSEQLKLFEKQLAPCVLFLGAQSGGIGLTIHASLMFVYELPQSYKDWKQLIQRLIRPSNPFPKIQIIRMDGPVQARMWDLYEEHLATLAQLGYKDDTYVSPQNEHVGLA